MSSVKMGPMMQRAIDPVLEAIQSRYYRIKCEICYNGKTVIPDYVNDFKKTVRFNTNYLEITQMSCKLYFADWIDVHLNYQDITVGITLTSVHHILGYALNNREPISYTYKAFLSNTEDISKILPRGVLDDKKKLTTFTKERAGIQLPVQFQLLKKEEWELRNKGLNFIMANVGMKDVMTQLASSWDLQLKMVEPDNTKIYQDIAIRPFANIEVIMDKLQSEYSVYQKGISYFVGDGTLYIWPSFETEVTQPLDDEPLYIYQIPEEDYIELKGFDAELDGGWHILSQGVENYQKLNDKGTENTATGVMRMNDANKVDFFKEADSTAALIIEGTLDIVQMETTGGYSSSRERISNTQFNDLDRTPFPASTKMAITQSEIVSLRWHKAVPDKIKPHKKVIFLYEGSEGLQSQNGTVEIVDMTFGVISRPSLVSYTAEALIGVRLTPLQPA